MKIIILAAASLATLTATTAYAESRAEKREDVRDSARKVAEEREDLRDAQRWGDRHDVREARKGLRDAQHDLRKDRRDAYRAGAYVRPSGWQARTWNNGQRLPANYYGRSYWIEPSRYGLSPAARGERWVRVDRDVVRISPNGTILETRRGWFY